MNTGAARYNTGEDCFVSLPPVLYGACWLESLDYTFGGPGIPVQLTISHDARVYIGIDTSIQQRPEPMNGFSDTKTFIYTDSKTCHVFRVFTKRFAAGDTLIPGIYTFDTRFIIAATPASNIEPAYDLKVTTSYKAINASASPGITKETINGKPAMVFKNTTDTLQWYIHTGVADTYSLTIRYANPLQQTVTARLQLIDENEHLLNEQIVQLSPSPPGKWNYLNSSTGTTINAGSYRLRLISQDADGLAIDGLDVQ